MSYQESRMKKLLETDRFLHHTFEEIKRSIGDEDEALKMVFDAYVLKEPMMRNAYVHLT
ncbi:hypothetical protein ACFPU1_07265 [Thalassorhabdus alkalitolerans]|uniref:Uncharacterized protein n=2 Tax=Thalassorhabdus alkalitolerans TaxID=2282697 RepID=A0ABW0YJG8_9BACI|nr:MULTISPECIES: hypothetical protein [Bacillaceae]